MRLAMVLWLAGCGSEDGKETLPEGCDAAIRPGDDTRTAQEVFIGAREGDVICFLEGAYAFDAELSLATDGVTVQGAGPGATILDFSAQQTGGTGANGISITGDDVTVTALAIVDTDGDGLRVTDAASPTFTDLWVSWTTPANEENGGYGLYPVGCTGVVVEGCRVSGASDTGIYVGQSDGILVRGNEVFENVVGIEIENSTDAEVVDNDAHGNAGGILAFNLPNLPMQGGARANVHDNRVVDNDGVNFADPSGTVAIVPPGTGILMLATDDNEIHHNEITGNQTSAVMILSYNQDFLGAFDDANFDPYPQGNWVHDNVLADNGDDPDGLAEVLIGVVPFPDLSWDGCVDPAVDNSDGSRTNCFSGNADATYMNFDWCNGMAGQTTDIGPVTCEHEPLPTQE